jgi:hypothetical protein
MRQRVHDALLHVRWRGEMTACIGHLGHALPEFDVALGVATPYSSFWQLAVEPSVNGGR